MAFRRARRGTAALEFALVAPVLVLLFAGVVSFGIGLRTQMEVGSAARAGAAYAASNLYDEDKIRAAAQSATLLATNVKVTFVKSAPGCTDPANGVVSLAACLTGAKPATYVTVTTELPYTFIIPPPGFEPTTTFRGKSVARLP